MKTSRDLSDDLHSGSDTSDSDVDEKPSKASSSLLEDESKEDTESTSSEEDALSLEDEDILIRTDNRWALRSKLFIIVALSIVLVVVVTISKIRSMKLDSSSDPVGFQHSGSQRSTMDIIYSCVSTTIICTISVMHFNVSARTAHRLKFREKISSHEFWREAWRKISYWSVGLLMPELLVIISCREYYDALEDCLYMEKKCPGWTLKHSFFALMKGFTIKDGDRIYNGRELYKRGAKLDKNICDRYLYEIDDKSKADVLTKMIAITQITRFLLEVIARDSYGLPISPLEYFTCAQVFAALFTYVYWLEKPHGVQEKIRVERGRKRRVGENLLNLKQSRMFVVGGYAALLIAASALTSWHVPFPNHSVRTLWKVASIVSAVCPILAIYSSWLEDIFNPSDEIGDWFAAFIGLVFFLHCAFRALLLALIFYSFWNLPPETYETRSWLDFIPFFH